MKKVIKRICLGLGVKIFGKWAIEQYIKIFELCFSFFIQKYKYKTKYKTKYTSFNRIDINLTFQ